MSEDQTEMTLREWCGKLSDFHLANRQLKTLVDALTEFRAAFANRGEKTSLYTWDQRMREADAKADAALEHLKARGGRAA